MRSGFIAIIGRPNVGKSTLLNVLVGRKISIITPKPQTTRTNIQGIFNGPDAQIVFVDTPGIHKPHFKLGEYMNKVAFSSVHDVDATLLVIDSSLPFGEGDQYLIEHVHPAGKLILVFNKIDLSTVEKLAELKQIYAGLFQDAEVFETVAADAINVDKLLKRLIELLPEGPRYFPEGVYCDHPESFVISEIIREKIMLLTKEEVPHSVAVAIDKITPKKDKTDIYATIIVEKDSQKGIMIGAGGKKIKSIGIRARRDIEELLGVKVNLILFVSVEEGWRDSAHYLKQFGYKEEE
jgi:GTPase